jgi:hypothetical protein
MRPGELMTTILETHQFKDRDRQAILLAVDAARSTKGKGRDVVRARGRKGTADTAASRTRDAGDVLAEPPAARATRKKRSAKR